MNKNGEWRAIQTSKEGALFAPSRSSAQMRASQAKKIRELRQALIDAGFVSLDQQATALGLPRSTTWAVLKGNHKCSGLRAGLIARIWNAPKLPPAAKKILADYVIEKSRGAYGHNDSTRKRFIAQLDRSGFPRINTKALQSASEMLAGDRPV